MAVLQQCQIARHVHSIDSGCIGTRHSDAIQAAQWQRKERQGLPFVPRRDTPAGYRNCRGLSPDKRWAVSQRGYPWPHRFCMTVAFPSPFTNLSPDTLLVPIDRHIHHVLSQETNSLWATTSIHALIIPAVKLISDSDGQCWTLPWLAVLGKQILSGFALAWRLVHCHKVLQCFNFYALMIIARLLAILFCVSFVSPEWCQQVGLPRLISLTTRSFHQDFKCPSWPLSLPKASFFSPPIYSMGHSRSKTCFLSPLPWARLPPISLLLRGDSPFLQI